MIVDRIENSRLYAPLHKQFQKAFTLARRRGACQEA